MELRLLTERDVSASTSMSHHAFGVPTGGGARFLGPGILRWGLFDGEVLAAKTVDRSYESYIGGRRVATAGVAGVAVAPEYRGTGLARRMMTHLLAEARARGAVISTLFRTAPGLYRALGYEQVAELVDGALPAAALRGIRGRGIALRRAAAADGRDIRDVYATVAASGSCLLTRDGPAFDATDDQLISAFDGITLAQDDTGATVGYLSWNRGSGYGERAALAVSDLLATTADGYGALLAAAASFESVTPTLTLRTSGSDPVHWLVPGAGWRVTEVRPYMLRVVDLVGAVAARGWPAAAVADVVLLVDDPTCPWNTGRHRLLVEGGAGRIESSGPSAAADGDGSTTLTPGGLAVLYAGGIPVSALRRAGLVSGGSTQSDAALDAAFAGPRPAILDYF